jgi:molybdopterin converting factor small subunit
LSFVVSVNGKVTDADYLLKDGDQIALFLPTAGG